MLEMLERKHKVILSLSLENILILISQTEMLLFISHKAVKVGVNSTNHVFIINCCSI